MTGQSTNLAPSQRPRKKSRRWLGLVVKLFLTTILLIILFNEVDIDKVINRIFMLNIADGLIIGALTFLGAFLVAVRWMIIARTLLVPLPLLLSLNLVLTGIFFNQLLPSSIGGDGIRVWLLSRHGTPLAPSVASVILDRLVAVLGLFVLLLFSYYWLMNIGKSTTLNNTLLLFATGVLIGCLVFAFIGARLLSWLDQWRLLSKLVDQGHYLLTLMRRPEPFFIVLIMSVLLHALTGLTIVVIARALGVNFNLLDSLALTPLILFSMMIPFTIAGWGLRESAMVVGLGMVGIAKPEALAVSISFGIVLLLSGIPGGVLWLTTRHQNKVDVTQKNRADEE